MLKSKTVRVFRHSYFSDSPTANSSLEADKKQLYEDFKLYIQSGKHLSESPFQQFGRDELYDHMNTPSPVKLAALRHVHIVPVKRVGKFQRKYDTKSDVHLVYCIDSLTGHVCAIALIEPAHDLAKDAAFLTNLAEAAEEFYSQASSL